MNSMCHSKVTPSNHRHASSLLFCTTRTPRTRYTGSVDLRSAQRPSYPLSRLYLGNPISAKSIGRIRLSRIAEMGSHARRRVGFSVQQRPSLVFSTLGYDAAICAQRAAVAHQFRAFSRLPASRGDRSSAVPCARPAPTKSG